MRRTGNASGINGKLVLQVAKEKGVQGHDADQYPKVAIEAGFIKSGFHGGGYSDFCCGVSCLHGCSPLDIFGMGDSLRDFVCCGCNAVTGCAGIINPFQTMA